MPKPKDAAPESTPPPPPAPKTSVRYVTLDGVRVARSATEADARKYIDELTNEPGGIARVRASHNIPEAPSAVLDVEPGADGEVY